MRVIAVHLLNDYSGSPKVLKQLLNGWQKRNVDLHLFTCGGREGFLSNIRGITNHYYWYRFIKNPVLRFFYLFFSQFVLAVRLMFFLRKKDVLYINTVLPFGAAIAGKIRGNKVIYHIHETSMKPQLLKQFLFGMVKYTASDVVYVSEFLAGQEPLNIRQHVIHNALEEEFIKQSSLVEKNTLKHKIVLMLCSLKVYKGVNEFVQLAKMNPDYIFKLVVNSHETEIDVFFKTEELPQNLIIYPTQVNTHPFYKEASLVVNLSDPDLWVETFGLTVLEAMSYSLPTIVPPVGGVTELVEQGKNGFLINSKDTVKISEAMQQLFQNNEMYNSMSSYAKKKSLLFSPAVFEEKSFQILS